MKVEGTGSLLGHSTGSSGQLLQACTYMDILYLRHRETILVILCMIVPIITAIACQWLNNLVFHGDIKCITANGEAMIHVSAE